MQVTDYTRMAISTNSLTIYNGCPKKVRSEKVTSKSKQNLKKKHTSKHLTERQGKRLRKIINNWALAIFGTQEHDSKLGQSKKKQFVMITLTLPSSQIESDKEIKRKYLNNFLIQLQECFVGLMYLWVAEKQKNGNIHFHIIVDSWCDKKVVSSIWNRVLGNGDYIKKFKKKFGHASPPSVKLTGQHRMKNPSEYLAKYVSKAEKSLEIEGRKWGCSRKLLEIEKINFPYNESLDSYFTAENGMYLESYFENEYVRVYYFDLNFLINFWESPLFVENKPVFDRMFSSLYPTYYKSIQSRKNPKSKPVCCDSCYSLYSDKTWEAQQITEREHARRFVNSKHRLKIG